MKVRDLEKLSKEGGDELLTPVSRRLFLSYGLKVTGVFLGGTILSVAATTPAKAMLAEVDRLFSSAYYPHYSMVINLSRCNGCKLCVDACSRVNNVAKGAYRTAVLRRETGGPDGARMVEFLPVLCNHCDRPPCVQACPTKATYKDQKHGIVMIEQARCIGCKACMVVCPYNARYYSEESGSVDGCDFCFRARLFLGNSTPACVEACPKAARIFGDLSDDKSSVFRLVRAPGMTAWVLRPDAGTMPNVFYVKD